MLGEVVGGRLGSCPGRLRPRPRPRTSAGGLLLGLLVPAIGLAAQIALVLYFAGAVVTVVRARWYAHIPFPLVYAAPVVGALALGLAA